MIVLAAIALWIAAPVAQAPLTVIASIALPGVEGRFDHMTFDAAHQRLFIAALGNDTVEVVDVAKGVREKSLAGFHEPTGITWVPDAGAVAVANGSSGALQIIDAADLRLTRGVAIGNDADNVRYDAAAKRLHVGHGGGALATVGAADGRLVANVRLGGHPESFQLERMGSRIFVNVPDARQIAVIDRRTNAVVGLWPVTAATANYPMALDESTNRLFIGCRNPAKALVYETTSGRIVGSFDIVGDADDLFYDEGRKRLYVTGGDGFVDVFQRGAGDAFTRTAHVASASGARTSL